MMSDGEPIDYGDAAKYINDPSIEMAWAVRTYERANIHMNLLCSVQPSQLRLNKHQDEIYAAFRREFPDLDVSKVTEVELKGDTKPKWRELCESFQTTVDDFNMGTLLRMEATKAYSDENTIIVPRMIYLFIEIARNVEGVNDRCKEEFTKDHKSNEEKEKEEEAREEEERQKRIQAEHQEGEEEEDDEEEDEDEEEEGEGEATSNQEQQ